MPLPIGIWKHVSRLLSGWTCTESLRVRVLPPNLHTSFRPYPQEAEGRLTQHILQTDSIEAMARSLKSECDGDVALEENLPPPSVVTATERLLKGFADKTRLRLLCLLRDREVCVHELVDALDMSQSAISHQLRVLRDARLVTHRREGRHVYYRLADAHVREMLENALTHGAEPESS